jgi:hypothetical protein
MISAESDVGVAADRTPAVPHNQRRRASLPSNVA